MKKIIIIIIFLTIENCHIFGKNSAVNEDLNEEELNLILSDKKTTSAKRNFKILIDPGHGGKDPGTIGRFKKIKEKDIVFNLSRILKKKLDNDYSVYLTRYTDKYLTLEERTAIANKLRSNLFISIHVNYSNNHNTSGVQTFYLNNSTDKAVIKLAKRENALANTLDFIKLDLAKTDEANQSVDFAKIAHQEIINYMNGYYKTTQDQGVKAGLFYVLWGARMPSILIEIAFLSNREEERLLTDRIFLDRMADAIAQGIKKYLK